MYEALWTYLTKVELQRTIDTPNYLRHPQTVRKLVKRALRGDEPQDRSDVPVVLLMPHHLVEAFRYFDGG